MSLHCQSNMNSRPFIVLFGPTASGKSSLAVHLAQHLGGTVINADSRQLFQGLPILSACPTPTEKKRVPHELYEILPWSSGPINAHDWAQRASTCLDTHMLGIVTGGTGFYLNTLIHGISPLPPINPKLSNFLKRLCAKPFQAHVLYTLLKQWDPGITFHANNTVYLHRALCIICQTKKKPSLLKQVPPKVFTPHKPFIISLLPAKPHLDKTIATRAAHMMDTGVIEEAKTFYEHNKIIPPVLGFNLLLRCADNTVSAEKTLEQLIYATRQYAKRQLSFGRHHMQAHMTWPDAFCQKQWSAFCTTFTPLWKRHCSSVSKCT